MGAARRAASGATTALITGGGCGETVGAADTSGSAAVWAGGTDTTPAERFGSGCGVAPIDTATGGGSTGAPRGLSGRVAAAVAAAAIGAAPLVVTARLAGRNAAAADEPRGRRFRRPTQHCEGDTGGGSGPDGASRAN